VITPERIRTITDHYAEGPRLLEAAIAGIGREEMHFRPGPEHWSIHENAIHVVDCDLLVAVRIRYILTQPGTTLVGFDQGAWARVFRYAERSVNEALSLFRALRGTTVAVVETAPADAWDRSIETENGPRTLERLVDHYGRHVDYHLRTIAKRRRQFADRRV